MSVLYLGTFLNSFSAKAIINWYYGTSVEKQDVLVGIGSKLHSANVLSFLYHFQLNVKIKEIPLDR